MRATSIIIAAAVAFGSVELAVSRCAAEEAVAASPGVYEVLRPGDRDMSCQQLASEANALNAQLLAQQNAKANSARNKQVAGAVGGGLLKSAGHFGLSHFGGFGGMGGLIARQAAEQATDAAAQAVATSGQEDPNAAPGVTPEQQRMNHLLGLYKEKSC